MRQLLNADVINEMHGAKFELPTQFAIRLQISKLHRNKQTADRPAPASFAPSFPVAVSIPFPFIPRFASNSAMPPV